MMATEQIIALSNEAAARAAQDRLTPYVPWDAEEVARYGPTEPDPVPEPRLVQPDGWELLEHRMADKTGWGDEDEPAMTVGQLRAWVIENIEDRPRATGSSRRVSSRW